MCIRDSISGEVGPVSFESIDRARAILASKSDHLMIGDVNRMSLRQFNQAWDRYVIGQEAKAANAQTSLLSQINPRSREAMVLMAMLENGINAVEKRLSQREILNLALGSVPENDHKKVFFKLKELGAIKKGANGRGFFLTNAGEEAAKKLSVS